MLRRGKYFLNSPRVEVQLFAHLWNLVVREKRQPVSWIVQSLIWWHWCKLFCVFWIHCNINVFTCLSSCPEYLNPYGESDPLPHFIWHHREDHKCQQNLCRLRYTQGGHGTGKTGKTGNLVLTFSRQGKHREFCFDTGKNSETQGKYFSVTQGNI